MGLLRTEIAVVVVIALEDIGSLLRTFDLARQSLPTEKKRNGEEPELGKKGRCKQENKESLDYIAPPPSRKIKIPRREEKSWKRQGPWP